MSVNEAFLRFIDTGVINSETLLDAEPLSSSVTSVFQHNMGSLQDSNSNQISDPLNSQSLQSTSSHKRRRPDLQGLGDSGSTVEQPCSSSTERPPLSRRKHLRLDIASSDSSSSSTLDPGSETGFSVPALDCLNPSKTLLSLALYSPKVPSPKTPFSTSHVLSSTSNTPPSPIAVSASSSALSSSSCSVQATSSLAEAQPPASRVSPSYSTATSSVAVSASSSALSSSSSSVQVRSSLAEAQPPASRVSPSYSTATSSVAVSVSSSALSSSSSSVQVRSSLAEAQPPASRVFPSYSTATSSVAVSVSSSALSSSSSSVQATSSLAGTEKPPLRLFPPYVYSAASSSVAVSGSSSTSSFSSSSVQARSSLFIKRPPTLEEDCERIDQTRYWERGKMIFSKIFPSIGFSDGPIDKSQDANQLLNDLLRGLKVCYAGDSSPKEYVIQNVCILYKPLLNMKVLAVCADLEEQGGGQSSSWFRQNLIDYYFGLEVGCFYIQYYQGSFYLVKYLGKRTSGNVEYDEFRALRKNQEAFNENGLKISFVSSRTTKPGMVFTVFQFQKSQVQTSLILSRLQLFKKN